MNHKVLEKKDFESLLNALHLEGYSVIGPQISDGAIVYQTLDNSTQLPIGFTDRQQPGSYTLNKSQHNHWFAWANGPQALKPLLFKPEESLWTAFLAKDDDKTISFEAELPQVKPTAVLGVRACDLAALELQDKHFLQKEYVDPYYQKRRESLFLIAVNCSHPSENCFCASTGDGPFVQQSYDIVLTEIDDLFLISSGSEKGDKICRQLDLQDATDLHIESSSRQESHSINSQKKMLPVGDIASMLKNKTNHPQWDVIAETCLSCGNCTSVCPSCFCHSEKDLHALDGKSSEHIRLWDSCFSQEHGHIHGASIRTETSKQYRQWMTHKFSAWVEQYGSSGCVGCGRCISWCPVGIDVTEQLRILCDE